MRREYLCEMFCKTKMLMCVQWHIRYADGERVRGVESGKLEVFNRVPLARIGQLEEDASVFAFLLSDEAKYVMGSVYTIDGDVLA